MTNQLSTDLLLSHPKENEQLKRMKALILGTDASDYGSTAARLGLAGIIFPHGAQKALGWFGGHGWEGTMEFFTSAIGLPSPIAAAVILIELLGPLLLLAGMGTRFIAISFIGLMIGAIVSIHGQHGFFMNWYGQATGEGFEYHLLFISLAVVLVIRGGGALSADAAMSK